MKKYEVITTDGQSRIFYAERKRINKGSVVFYNVRLSADKAELPFPFYIKWKFYNGYTKEIRTL